MASHKEATDKTTLPTDALRQGQWPRTENAVSTLWRVQFSFSWAEPEKVSSGAVDADTGSGSREEFCFRLGLFLFLCRVRMSIDSAEKLRAWSRSALGETIGMD